MAQALGQPEPGSAAARRPVPVSGMRRQAGNMRNVAEEPPDSGLLPRGLHTRGLHTQLGGPAKAR